MPAADQPAIDGRRRLLRALLAGAPLALCAALPAAAATNDPALQVSVDELRHSIGRWKVATGFLKPDGSVAKAAEGTYEFAWVVPDRVVSGRSDIPSLQQAAGILFFINEKKRQIVMVSVAADGHLWTMTGPLGGEQRLTQEFATAAGGTGQLRFTRFNVSADAFESTMEYREDGGRTWTASAERCG